MRRSRGLTLGTVLAIAALAVVLGFSLAAVGTYQIGLSASRHNHEVAKERAESAISQTIGVLAATPTFGRQGESVAQIDTAVNHTPAAGVVCFKPQQTLSQVLAGSPVLSWLGVGAAQQTVPCSLNNFDALQPMPSRAGWNGLMVPASSIQLLGCGYAGAEVVQVECIVDFPPFNYAVASSGPLEMESSQVASVKSVADVPNGPLLPGNVLSDNGSPAALTVGDGCLVKGDARACGEVVVAPQGTVAGEVLNQQQAVSLPTLNAADYDPMAHGPYLPLPDTLPDLTLDGWCRRQGDLTVTGDLKLDNCVLFATGNVTVQGAVTGTGAIVVEGNLKLAGGAQIANQNAVCVLCNGQVEVDGSGARNLFVGVIYCRNNFLAQHMTLVGSFLMNAPDPASTLRLVDSSVYWTAQTVGFSMPTEADFALRAAPALTIGSMVEQPGQPPAPTGKAPTFDLLKPTVNSVSALDDVFLLGVTTRNGQPLYRLYWHGIDPTTGQTRTPPFRIVPPDSPWATLGLHTLPTSAVGVLESTTVKGLMVKLNDDLKNVIKVSDVAAASAALRKAIERDIQTAQSQMVPMTSVSGNFWFDPNQYLSISDRMRIAYWHVLP
ncbi:MAG: hypothetical protein ACYCW6_11720 [Candidatus Xenobia bacterium]